MEWAAKEVLSFWGLKPVWGGGAPCMTQTHIGTWLYQGDEPVEQSSALLGVPHWWTGCLLFGAGERNKATVLRVTSKPDRTQARGTGQLGL